MGTGTSTLGRMKVAEVRQRLLSWYRGARRDLPWRRRSDPYATWISEIMLQQTRVDTVIPYFERFLERWPNASSLAAADPDQVRAAWSGLGYYRRAQLMLRAAHTLVAEHQGQLPRDLEALRALPGFGRYTAGAVASIAFDLPTPAVDGNVCRVLARLHGIEGDVSRGAPHEEVWKAATRLAPGEAPGELTQALIELGALVCTPKSPKCLLCPLASVCEARGQGRTDQIPPPKKRGKRGQSELTSILAVEGDAIWLERQPKDGLFAELWCLPWLEGHLSPDQAVDEAERKYGWSLTHAETAAKVTHVLTHRDIHLVVMRAHGSPPAERGFLRVPVGELDRHGIPTITVRALKAGLPRSLLKEAVLPGRGPSVRS